MIINNVYDVHIVIHDIDLFDSGCASGINCNIFESILDSVPACRIKFNSSPEFLSDFPIVDGTKITISINSDALSIKEQYVFRVMNFSAVPVGNNFSYCIDGVIDFYELFRSPEKYSMKNNSCEVFKLLIKQNDLIGSVHETQDNQLWAPTEANLGQWLGYIANHGWSSQSSCFYWFMNREKNLFYLDIDKLFYESKNPVQFYYGDTVEDDIKNRIVRYKNVVLKTAPGEENLFNRGYDGDNYHFDLSSYSTLKIKSNKVRANSEIININKELSNGLSRNILQFDVGNHHENFFLAESQNQRILSTFSTYIGLSCEFFRPLKLSQISTLSATSPSKSSGEIQSLNIKYIVSKIITNINSSTVNMDVELCSQGYNGLSVESY